MKKVDPKTDPPYKLKAWITDQVGDDIFLLLMNIGTIRIYLPSEHTYHQDISLGLKVCGRLSLFGITLAAIPKRPDSVQVTSLENV